MSKFSAKLRSTALILATALLMPYTATAQNAGYNFTDIDIPVEPIYDGAGESRYTENLWEVTDEGVYDENGYQVGNIEEGPVGETVPGEEGQPAVPNLPKIPEKADTFEEYKQSLINSWGGRRSFAEERLRGVRENLAEQKERFDELDKQIAETEEKLEPIREQIAELQGAIDLINSQIRVTREKITNVEVMIAEKQIEIKDALLFLQRADVELDIQKEVVLDYVTLLYQEENRFFDLYDDGSSTLKLLLADNSVSENLLGQEYFEIMESTGRQVFYDLERRRQEYQERQDDILREQEDLEFLYDALNKEKKTLEESRLAKSQLLAETQGQEDEYELLLEQALQQQLEAAIAVQNLQDNLELIESKLDTLDDGLEEVQSAQDESDLTQFEEIKETVDMMDSVEGGAEEALTVPGSRPFIWPVPANKITTKFHDPTYPKRWGIHNAIDIRSKQYTEIKAPANAYVFQTKDNGMGYSYIVLAHKNNLVTVYGHVSEILVTAGTLVKKGEVIGLSGGTPGTKGAGLQTTGPHLHFEVYYKGEPVDPLKYLPLADLPIEYVPDEYLSELR